MGNRIVLTVIFLVFTLCSFGDNVFNGAQWISIPKSQNTPNQWLCFRKQIECADKNTVAKLNIAVDSKYWLWVNDSLVVFEGGLKRGPNSQDTYYDCIDISDFLERDSMQFPYKSGFGVKTDIAIKIVVGRDYLLI